MDDSPAFYEGLTFPKSKYISSDQQQISFQIKYIGSAEKHVSSRQWRVSFPNKTK